MHTLYKATFSDTVISERHTARDIHSNIIQKSNSGMSASTNVYFVCGQKQIAPSCSQYLQYSRMHTCMLQVKIYTARDQAIRPPSVSIATSWHRSILSGLFYLLDLKLIWTNCVTVCVAIPYGSHKLNQKSN